MIALLVAGALFASAGEQVTREDTGQVICTITRDMYRDTLMTADGWCADWTIAPPVNGTIVPLEARGWIRHAPGRGVQLHVGDSWR